MGFECLFHPLSTQLEVGIGEFDAHRFVAFLHRSQHRGAGTRERVEDSAPRRADLHHIPHELQRLFGHMDAVGGVGLTKYPRQTAHIALQRHLAVGTPNDKLRLLAEPPPLRAAGRLIPYRDAAPGPPGPLQGVGHGGQLPPVDEQTDGRTGLAGGTHHLEPFTHPPGPATLVHLIAVEIWQRFVAAQAAVLLGGGTVLGRLAGTAAGIGRVGDNGIEGVFLKLRNDPHSIAVQDRPVIPAPMFRHSKIIGDKQSGLMKGIRQRHHPCIIE